MSQKPEVMIDGVRYVPAVDIRPPTVARLREELLKLWWGDTWPEDAGATVYITISDDEPETEHPDLQPTVDDFCMLLTAKLAEEVS